MLGRTPVLLVLFPVLLGDLCLDTHVSNRFAVLSAFLPGVRSLLDGALTEITVTLYR